MTLRRHVDASLRDKYAHSIQRGNIDQKPVLKLTNRELEFLKGIASELSCQEIDTQLFIINLLFTNLFFRYQIKTGTKNRATQVALFFGVIYFFTR